MIPCLCENTLITDSPRWKITSKNEPKHGSLCFLPQLPPRPSPFFSYFSTPLSKRSPLYPELCNICFLPLESLLLSIKPSIFFLLSALSHSVSGCSLEQCQYKQLEQTCSQNRVHKSISPPLAHECVCVCVSVCDALTWLSPGRGAKRVRGQHAHPHFDFNRAGSSNHTNMHTFSWWRMNRAHSNIRTHCAHMP